MFCLTVNANNARLARKTQPESLTQMLQAGITDVDVWILCVNFWQMQKVWFPIKLTNAYINDSTE